VSFARQAGVETEVVPYAEYRGERISSTRIRTCLERGEIEDANAMMGRRLVLSGERAEGKHLGREIGFPTINLRLSATGVRLPLGVYEVEVGGEKGIANYGVAPTMGDKAWREPVLEVHVLGTLPSPSVESVEVVRFLRPERTFATVEELKRQIAADCAAI